MEQMIESLDLTFAVTNNSLSIKDERGASDLCYDTAYIELKNVHVQQ